LVQRKKKEKKVVLIRKSKLEFELGTMIL